jgi:hypothetical protein
MPIDALIDAARFDADPEAYDGFAALGYDSPRAAVRSDRETCG